MYVNLKMQMWKSGIRQNRLARTLGIDETALSRIVNGFREPSAPLRQRIAAALECDPAWLFSEAKEQTAEATAAPLSFPQAR
jgi:transcriptional regulator with XRE-family HTH domain